jgi:hypothetical protein
VNDVQILGGPWDGRVYKVPDSARFIALPVAIEEGQIRSVELPIEVEVYAMEVQGIEVEMRRYCARWGHGVAG